LEDLNEFKDNMGDNAYMLDDAEQELLNEKAELEKILES
jgi:hypothetical protein